MAIVFLIPVFKDVAVRMHDVASHAANAWMTDLIRALIAHGKKVRTIGHEPARVWPLGRHLLPGDPEHLQRGFAQRLVKYVNLPLVRHFFLCLGYRNAIQKEIAKESDSIVCTYNPLPWQIAGAKAAVQKGARWISVVLDDEVVARHGWSRYVNQTRLASGHVFVSQWAFDHAPVRNKILFEGGVDLWQANEVEQVSQIPSVMYSGLLCDAAGQKELVALIDSFSNQDVEFWICGKGDCPDLVRRARRDRRIKMLGFVSDTELDRLYRSAWVLINPRSATHEASRMNFPSKLLRYLSYGKPIVTVWTPGIPTEYREVLKLVDPEVFGSSSSKLGQEMGAMVNAILSWNNAERMAWRQKLNEFVVPCKLWKTTVSHLSDFIEDVSCL
jgi:glycosyltransferase involved in cell wall biosynthesis